MSMAILMVVDFTGPLDKLIYSVLVNIAEISWWLNRVFLTIALIVRGLRLWFVSQMASMLDSIFMPMGALFTFVLLLVSSIYGFSRVASSFTNGWSPVQSPGRILIIAIFTAMYLSSGSALVVTIEAARSSIFDATRAASYTATNSAVIGLVEGNSPPISVNWGLDGDDSGLSALDAAGSFVGVTNISEFSNREIPVGLQKGYAYLGDPNCCFSYAYSLGDFENKTDAERSRQIQYAYDGISVLSLAPTVILFAIAEEFVYTILIMAAFVLYVSFPIALIFSPFSFSAGQVGVYANKYFALIAETIVTAIFMGLANGMITSAANLPNNAFLAVALIGFFIAAWRSASAMKLTYTSVQQALSSNPMSGGSALSMGDVASAGTGVVMGGAMVAAGVAMGNPLLAAQGAGNALGAVQGKKGGGNNMGTLLAMAGMAKGGGAAADGASAITAASSTTTPLQAGLDKGQVPYKPAKEPVEQSKKEPHSVFDAENPKIARDVIRHEQGRHMPSGDEYAISSMPGQYVSEWADEVGTVASADHRDRALLVGEKAFGKRSAETLSKVAQTQEGREAIKSVSDKVGRYVSHARHHKRGDGDILHRFQTGEAFNDISQHLTEDEAQFLDRDHFNALSDAVLRPQRTVGYDDIIGAMPEMVHHDGSALDGVAAGLGLPDSTFGPYSGMINNLAVNANENGFLNSLPDDSQRTYLQEASDFVAAGDRAAAQNVLYDAAKIYGGDANEVRETVQDIEMIQKMVPQLTIQQTTAFQPFDHAGYKRLQSDRNNRLRSMDQLLNEVQN